jgi:hypothetical protein
MTSTHAVPAPARTKARPVTDEAAAAAIDAACRALRLPAIAAISTRVAWPTARSGVDMVGEVFTMLVVGGPNAIRRRRDDRALGPWSVTGEKSGLPVGDMQGSTGTKR